ncbi:hypothetical protein [Actinoplanes sp. ATCC 53533]|uniref:hypothetical protein n=1 Tax=Actinoplanes sp. ATCC 53533 TaxID=1288362 RepID=UPI000F7B0DD5|nr:hypothetical protein [Actinoplanes sp. ATCC 53533]
MFIGTDGRTALANYLEHERPADADATSTALFLFGRPAARTMAEPVRGRPQCKQASARDRSRTRQAANLRSSWTRSGSTVLAPPLDKA